MGFNPQANRTLDTAVSHYSKVEKSKRTSQEAKNKGCTALYNLPGMGEDHAEPCVWVSNHAVIMIESIRMTKEEGHVNTWRANRNHLICMRNSFKERAAS